MDLVDIVDPPMNKAQKGETLTETRERSVNIVRNWADTTNQAGRKTTPWKSIERIE